MSERLRLNVFTPLPPLMTDIAGHSAGFLPHLAEQAAVTVWSSQASVVGELGRAEVRHFDPAEPPFDELNGATLTFFNFGNNAQFHGDMFPIAAELPGVAVLHDLNLQHFYAGMAQTSMAHAQGYLRQMTRDHGAAGAEAAEQFLLGTLKVEELAARFPLSLGVAGRGLALVTHNAAAVGELEALTRLPVYFVPLSLRRMGPRPPERGAAAPPFRLVMFGHIGANRRLREVLEALATLPRGRFRLDVYGSIEDRAGVEALIAGLQLREWVRCHGFVSDAALDAALAGADLAVNLRFPTMGEASGSQLRIWAHALPSIVTRIGWYAALPAEAVFFVEPERERESLVGQLGAFAADPAAFRAAGRRGRAIVETTHTPEAYAGALLRIAEDAAVLHRRRGAMDLARSAAHRAVAIDEDGMLPAVGSVAARRIGELFGRG